MRRVLRRNAYRVHVPRHGRKKQPTIVLCAGYVCPDNFWKYLAPALAKKYRVLVWNYRGSGASGSPREPGYERVTTRPTISRWTGTRGT